jgi:SHS2 domain-containing protein
MEIRSAGHRSVVHTTDIEVEAWAPTCERCMVETVDALVDCFIVRPRPRPSESVEWSQPDNDPENLLADLLDGVVYHCEMFSQIPVTTTVDHPREWHIRFETADLDAAVRHGTAPEAVSLHDLRLRPQPGGWRCTAILDITTEPGGHACGPVPETSRMQRIRSATLSEPDR